MKRARQADRGGSVDLVGLLGLVERFAGKRVILFGDFVADEFQYGDITRVSREAPVLILRHRETHVMPGGGANAANNLAALGARVIPVTAVGEDASGAALLAYFREKGIDQSAIVRVKGWTTPTKTRFLAGFAHTVAQQVLRIDREPGRALPGSVGDKLRKSLTAKLARADALAVSDYGFGVASPETVRQAASARRKELPVTLDSRFQLHAYAKAGVTSATPNEAELEDILRTKIGAAILRITPDDRAGRR